MTRISRHPQGGSYMYSEALACCILLLADQSHCFLHPSSSRPSHWPHWSSLLPSSSLSSSEGEDEDWRDFRAKLVMSHRQEGVNKTDTSHWAYESGDAIEVGSLILACPEQDFGRGLRQQYFHKSVVLVIAHDERSFTKGIILNRPTDLVFGDENFCNRDGSPLRDAQPGRRWRCMYGGEVKGLESDDPEQTILHCLTSDAAKEVSSEVLNNVYWTTMAGARLLVTDGHASPDDFLVYCGYAGWSAGQLAGELDRGAWMMLQTSSGLVAEIKRTVDATHPERAGLDTWNMLVEKIGRELEASKSEGRFDDLMLLEWARHNLLLKHKLFAKKSVKEESNAIVERLGDLVESVGPGTMIRSASPSAEDDEQPFLLDDQEFSESCILIIQDDDAITVGVILNIPSAHSVDIEVGVEDVGTSPTTGNQTMSIPQRFGGRFGLKGQQTKPTVWLHNCEKLKEAKVGSPLGDDKSFWCCSQNDVSSALATTDVATLQDFICVNGFTVWEKSREEDTVGGLLAEILSRKFDVVPQEWSEDIYLDLVEQNESILTTQNLDSELELAREAWENAGGTSTLYGKEKCKGTEAEALANMARKSWWATFLLEDPSLRFGK